MKTVVILGVALLFGLVVAPGCAGAGNKEGPEEPGSGSGGMGGGNSTLSHPLPALPLSTEGRFIVDAEGKRFKLASVNWYGGESATLVVDGLSHAHRDDIARKVREMGFNSVRIPWCNELVARNPVVDPERVVENPDLLGKTVLEVMDAVIEAIVAQGLVVVLDNHRSRGDWCCDIPHGDGLWYTEEYPEEDFFAHWQMMTERYKDQPGVVGMDLRNELRGQLAPGSPASCGGACVEPTEENPAPECTCEWASWGDSSGMNRDFTVVAEDVGDAILSINPDLLIIVEGPHWASWLGVNYRHLQLSVPNKLVYSAHNYKMSQTFTDCPTLQSELEQRFGYVVNEGLPYTTPLWLGEFGIEHTDVGLENPWWVCFVDYMKQKDFDWAYWPLNGTQGPGYSRTDGAEEGYGILDVAWDAPAHAAHLEVLQGLQAPTLGPL